MQHGPQTKEEQAASVPYLGLYDIWGNKRKATVVPGYVKGRRIANDKECAKCGKPKEDDALLYLHCDTVGCLALMMHFHCNTSQTRCETCGLYRTTILFKDELEEE